MISRLYGYLCVVCLAGMGIGPTWEARGETLLRWKLKPGETLRYDFQQRSQSESSIAGKPTTVILDMAMRFGWQVEQVDPQGTATITQSIDRLSITMKVDDVAPVSYDSTGRPPTSGPGKEIADSVSVLIGGKFTVKLTDRGEIVSVEPSESLRQALEKTKAGDLFTTEGLSRIVRQTSIVLPEKAVAMDDSWEAAQRQPSPLGVLDVVNRYQFAGPEQRGARACEKITAVTTIALSAAKDTAMPPAVIKESEQSGTLWFDAAAGRFVSSVLQQRLLTEQPSGKRTIRIRTTSSLEMKLAEQQ